MANQQLTKSEVSKLFAEYDALENIKDARSGILKKIHDGYGAGPFLQGEARFKIVPRKINGTQSYRYILRMLESEAQDTKL